MKTNVVFALLLVALVYTLLCAAHSTVQREGNLNTLRMQQLQQEVLQ